MKFPDDGNYCSQWLINYTRLRSLVYLTPLVIIMINAMLTMFLRKVVVVEKRRNLTSELISATLKMFIAQFLNTAVVLLVINGGIPWITYSKDALDDFSVEWYREVGSTLVMTMLLNVITPHISNFMWQLIYGSMRCCDRSCSCDKRKTKKLLQEDYENVNTGNIFLFEFRFSSVLT